MSYHHNPRFLHARTSARELNLINRFCQLINFALHPHARGQRAAADGTPRHCHAAPQCFLRFTMGEGRNFLKDDFLGLPEHTKKKEFFFK